MRADHRDRAPYVYPEAPGSADYEATAEILITPLGIDDRAFLGVQVLRVGGDAGRTVLTAVGLVDSEAAAERTAKELGAPWTAERVRDHVDVDPRGGSSLVGVTGRDETAEGAAALATGFATAALEERKRRLAEQLSGALDDVNAQLGDLRRRERTTGYADQLRLRRDTLALAARTGDPTLSLAEAAPVPTSRPGRPLWLLLGAALVAGLALGVVAAIALDALDRRVRDEKEIDDLYPIPVLARIPVRRGRRNGAGDEVRALVSRDHRERRPEPERAGDQRVGRGGGDVDRGRRWPRARGVGPVGDPRRLRPALAGRRAVARPRRRPQAGAVRPRSSRASRGCRGLDSLRVLVPQSPNGDRQGQAELHRRLPDLVAQAQELADHVVIDTPPLGRHGDALWLTRLADRLVLVLTGRDADAAVGAHPRPAQPPGSARSDGRTARSSSAATDPAEDQSWREVERRGRARSSGVCRCSRVALKPTVGVLDGAAARRPRCSCARRRCRCRPFAVHQ